MARLTQTHDIRTRANGRVRVIGLSLAGLLFAVGVQPAWSVPLLSTTPGVYFNVEASYEEQDRPGGGVVNVLDTNNFSFSNALNSPPIGFSLPFNPTANRIFGFTPFGLTQFESEARVDNAVTTNLPTTIGIGLRNSTRMRADVVGGDFDGPEWDFATATSLAVVELRDQVTIGAGPFTPPGTPGTVDLRIVADGTVTAHVEALKEVVLVPGAGAFFPRFGSFQAVGSYSLEYTLFDLTNGSESLLYSIGESVVVEQKPNGELKMTQLASEANRALTATLPFVFGDPLDYAIQVAATAAIGIIATDGGKPEVLIDNDFLNTFTLTDFQVFDQNGARVNDATIQSAAGLRYPGTAAASAQAPAPATLGLFALGLAGLRWRLRPRRSVVAS